MWDLRTGKVTWCVMASGAAVMAARYQPDGEAVLTLDAGGQLKVWDGTSGQALKELRGGGHSLLAGYSPGGTSVIACSSEEKVSVWSSEVRPSVRALDESVSPEDGAFGPEGREIVTLTDRSVRLRDVETNRVVREVECRARSARRSGRTR